MTPEETKLWIEKEAREAYPLRTYYHVQSAMLAFIEGANLILNTLVAEKDQEIKRFLKGAINQYNRTEEKVTEIRQFRKNIEAKDAEIAELKAAGEKMADAVQKARNIIWLSGIDGSILTTTSEAMTAWNALTKKAE